MMEQDFWEIYEENNRDEPDSYRVLNARLRRKKHERKRRDEAGDRLDAGEKDRLSSGKCML